MTENSVENLEELVRLAKNRYQKAWRMRNPEKVREADRRFWLRRALEYKEAEKNGQ